MQKQFLTSSVYSFESLRNGSFLYVDKTEYIWQLVESANAMYFLSRPSRFGKLLTISTGTEARRRLSSVRLSAPFREVADNFHPEGPLSRTKRTFQGACHL